MKTIQIEIENIGKQEISLQEAREIAILHEGEIYGFFDEGTSRFVYVNRDMTKVLKMNKSKFSDFNKIEIEIYEKANQEDRSMMVSTKFLERGLIEQKFITPIKYGGRKLTFEQQNFANSCRGEVGWDENGNLLCFDLDDFKKY
jgi:hypothetical protein